MQTFIDAEGRLWPLRITVSTVRRVRHVVDLTNPEEWLADVYRDPCRLAEIAYSIAEPAVAAQGYTLEHLETALLGEYVDQLRSKLLEEVVSFFHDRLGRGELLARAIAQTERLLLESIEVAVQQITTSGSTATSGSSASTAES